MLKWLKKTSLNTQGKYYNSIDDFPLYNWIKCNNGEIEYVRNGEVGNEKKDYEIWCKLYDEYLTTFGLNRSYEKYLLAVKKKAILQAEYVITKERFKLTEIEIQNAKIKSLEYYFGDGQRIEVILLYLSKFIGYKIDRKKTSVLEYFTLLEEYGKANKKVGDS
jgi:hypothetical protein